MAAQPFFTISVLAVFDDLLHLVEILCADDSLMRVGDVVGRDGSFVLDLLFRNEVRRVDLLEMKVAFVFLVHQHLLDNIPIPFISTKLGLDVMAFQVVLDVGVGTAFQKHPEDQSNNLGFFLDDLDSTVFCSGIAHQIAVRDLVGPFFIFLPDAPFHVFRNAAAFFLRQGGHDSQQQLTFAIECPDVFFFEVDLHAMFFEFPNGGQGVDCVSGKSANRLGDDQVNLVVQRVLDHLLETFTVGCTGSRNTLIRINVDVIPICPLTDHVLVVGNLRFLAALLFVPIGGNSGVCSYIFSGDDGLNSDHRSGYRDFSYLHVFLLPSVKWNSRVPSRSMSMWSICSRKMTGPNFCISSMLAAIFSRSSS